MILTIMFMVSFLFIYILCDCNLDIKINPYLFLILRVNKKNQKKLYEVLKEEFERDDTF